MKRIITLLPLFILLLAACSTNNRNGDDGGEQFSQPEGPKNRLIIPELIDSRDNPEITVVMQHGQHEFFTGVPSETMGFNGDFLGPTIRLYKGTDATITWVNEIGEPTTVHGHGLHVDGNIDGGPQSVIRPDERWQITIPVEQEAGTSWYHPHLMAKTAHHVHAGLAGMYIIEDKNSQALDLPKTYGVNDIPVVIQDRSFTDGEMVKYAVTEQQLQNGLRENTLVINGTVNPYHNVPQGWVRLRLLNGSNARFYDFSLSNGASFYKIATEGGFLNQPVEIDSIKMAPGERNEIMIDLSAGENVTVIADLLPADPEDSGAFNRNIPQTDVLELRVDPTLQAAGSLPEIMNDIVYFDREDATHIRTFALEMDGNLADDATFDGDIVTSGYMEMFSVNGQPMDMSQINDMVTKGRVEIWQITGERMPHPFHMHGASFQILTINGEPPAEADRGWKDTVVVENEITEVIIRFDFDASVDFPYMLHCHMLEHEEGGMMAQFTVE